MKTKDAKQLLEPYEGDELYQKARELYVSEVEALIKARGGTSPTARCIESCLDQVSPWFLKVSQGLSWPKEDLPKKIIEWERGGFFVRYKVLDPKIDSLRTRTQHQILRGSCFPILDAMKPGDLEAVFSMMLGKAAFEAREWDRLHKARKAYAEKAGKAICFFGEQERACEHQETYVLNPDTLPTSTSDLVFVCKLPKCIKECVAGSW